MWKSVATWAACWPPSSTLICTNPLSSHLFSLSWFLSTAKSIVSACAPCAQQSVLSSLCVISSQHPVYTACYLAFDQIIALSRQESVPVLEHTGEILWTVVEGYPDHQQAHKEWYRRRLKLQSAEVHMVSDGLRDGWLEPTAPSGLFIDSDSYSYWGLCRQLPLQHFIHHHWPIAQQDRIRWVLASDRLVITIVTISALHNYWLLLILKRS